MVIFQPTMAKFVSMEKINGQDMVSFPPLDKARLGSSMSGRLIYYPNPLPYPEKLPITQTVSTSKLLHIPYLSDLPCTERVQKEVRQLIQNLCQLLDPPVGSTFGRLYLSVRLVSTIKSIMC